jgi:hypothetical protein
MGDAVGKVIAIITLNTLVVWIVVYHNRLQTAQPEERYTHFKQKEPRHTIHQRNPEYSPPKLSENEVSVVLPFSGSPSAFAPSSPISLPTDTSEWKDQHITSAKQLQRTALSAR